MTGSDEGTVTFTPNDPNGVSASGHFAAWFGESFNKKNDVQHSTNTFNLKATDASHIFAHETFHLSTNACGSRPPCVNQAGTVTRIDPGRGRVTATITVGLDPVAIAVGLGAVWVANRSSESLSRIDPTTNRVVATIKLSTPPAAIAVGGDAVWVAVG